MKDQEDQVKSYSYTVNALYSDMIGTSTFVLVYPNVIISI